MIKYVVTPVSKHLNYYVGLFGIIQNIDNQTMNWRFEQLLKWLLNIRDLCCNNVFNHNRA